MRIERAVGVRTTAFTDLGLPGKEWSGASDSKDKGTRREEGWGYIALSLLLSTSPPRPSALPSLTLTRQGTIPGRFSESQTILEDPTKWRPSYLPSGGHDSSQSFFLKRILKDFFISLFHLLSVHSQSRSGAAEKRIRGSPWVLFSYPHFQALPLNRGDLAREKSWMQLGVALERAPKSTALGEREGKMSSRQMGVQRGAPSSGREN